MSETASACSPLLVALIRARDVLAEVAAVDPMFLPPASQYAVLDQAVALTAQVAEVRARVLASLGSMLPASRGPMMERSQLSVIAMGVRGLDKESRFSTALARHGDTAAAMANGNVSPAQAAVICEAVDVIPAQFGADVREQAEQHLIEQAARFDPRQLKILGRRIVDVVAPDVADHAEARALEAEEARANDNCRLTLRRQGDGSTRFFGVLPDATAERFATYLYAFTNPRRTPEWAETATGEGAVVDEAEEKPWWRLPHSRKLGHAFCELLERLDPAVLPTHGTTPTEVIITTTLEQLQTELGVATLHTPEGPMPISAGEARRQACNAGIIPAVLGSKSEVLDLGRSTRLFSKAQKRALMINHQSCQAEWCDRPAPWTEVHHLDPWSRGGKTDHANAVLLCSRHHHQIHHHTWLHERLPDGSIRFSRRT